MPLKCNTVYFPSNVMLVRTHNIDRFKRNIISKKSKKNLNHPGILYSKQGLIVLVSDFSNLFSNVILMIVHRPCSCPQTKRLFQKILNWEISEAF